MSLFIHGFVIINLAFSVLLGGNAGCNTLLPQAIPEPISIIPPIHCPAVVCLQTMRGGQKVFGCGEVIQQLSGALIIRHLTRRQTHEHRLARAVADGMQFGV